MKKNVLYVTLIILLSCTYAYGNDCVVSSGPCWDTFTNRDGTGLYHEVFSQVFALYGMSVRHEYVPTQRGDELVRVGLADAMTCDDRASAELQKARYPMYVNDYHVVFDKSRTGTWRGGESLRDKEVVCQLGYYHDWDFSVPVRIRPMPSGVKCLQMVLLGRTDYYVDDMLFIKNSIKDSDSKFDRERFDIRKVGTRSYHPIFNKLERGKMLKNLFDEGIMVLHKSGKLRPIYDKWGHQYPDFDSF